MNPFKAEENDDFGMLMVKGIMGGAIIVMCVLALGLLGFLVFSILTL